MQTLYGFRLDIKTIRMICKRFAMRARTSFKAGEVPLEEEFKGKRVIIGIYWKIWLFLGDYALMKTTYKTGMHPLAVAMRVG